jgi:hypothetical protein
LLKIAIISLLTLPSPPKHLGRGFGGIFNRYIPPPPPFAKGELSGGVNGIEPVNEHKKEIVNNEIFPVCDWHGDVY